MGQKKKKNGTTDRLKRWLWEKKMNLRLFPETEAGTDFQNFPALRPGNKLTAEVPSGAASHQGRFP